jgi:hypothetical protein
MIIIIKKIIIKIIINKINSANLINSHKEKEDGEKN